VIETRQRLFENQKGKQKMKAKVTRITVEKDYDVYESDDEGIDMNLLKDILQILRKEDKDENVERNR